jgi:hypothetical protein
MNNITCLKGLTRLFKDKLKRDASKSLFDDTHDRHDQNKQLETLMSRPLKSTQEEVHS